MRTNFGFRLVGCTAFVAVCTAAVAQINVSGDPNAYNSQYTENFEEFMPEGTTSLTPTNVGLLFGTPILGGNAAISLTNPTDGTGLTIYNPTSDNAASATYWGIANAGYAQTYHKSLQGLGFGNMDNMSSSDQYLADITISLQPGQSDTYFGGFFQAAYFNTATNLNTGQITFTFFNGTNVVDAPLVVDTNADPSNVTNSLVGMAFTFDKGFSYTSVQISGDFVAMDSLRVDNQVDLLPEPSPFVVMGLGLGAIVLIRRRRA